MANDELPVPDYQLNSEEMFPPSPYDNWSKRLLACSYMEN